MDKNDLMLYILRNGGAVMEMPMTDDGEPDGEEFERQLDEVLASIPPAWVRFKHNEEWSKRNWLSDNMVVGAVLMGIMRSSGQYEHFVNGKMESAEDEIPQDLTSLASFLTYELRHNWPGQSVECGRIFEASLNELGAFLYPRILEGKWFSEKTCDPEVAVRNALIAIRTELREEARFEAKFASETEQKEAPEV